METGLWTVKAEYLDRNLVIVEVSESVPLSTGTGLTSEGERIVADVRARLLVEPYYAGVYSAKRPHELLFQYPTEKIMRVGPVVRINIPASMLQTRRDFVTLKKNPDGTVLVIP
ncbi:MAG: hypothetical protein QW767_06470 [Thermoprotei archaeon]